FKQARRGAFALVTSDTSLTDTSDSIAEAEEKAIPDDELRVFLGGFAQHVAGRIGKDRRWVRSIVFGEAGSFYQVMVRVCAEQFGSALDLSTASDLLFRVSRTRDLLFDALG